MHYEMMTVTPELAAKWLKTKNNRNRKFSPRKIGAYAGDLRAGDWKITHQNSIAFYKDGNLADGQHRLAAIVECGVSVEFMVWFGLDNDSAYGIDAHRARTASDQIRIAGEEDWIGKDAIATARMMKRSGRSVRMMMSPKQIVDFCHEHERAIKFAMSELGGSMPAPVRCAVALAFYYVDHDNLSKWCAIMKSGVGAVPLSRTVLTLRERLLRDVSMRSSSGPVRETIAKMSMRSIQAYCDGVVLTKLYEPKDRAYEIPA